MLELYESGCGIHTTLTDLNTFAFGSDVLCDRTLSHSGSQHELNTSDAGVQTQDGCREIQNAGDENTLHMKANTMQLGGALTQPLSVNSNIQLKAQTATFNPLNSKTTTT